MAERPNLSLQELFPATVETRGKTPYLVVRNSRVPATAEGAVVINKSINEDDLDDLEWLQGMITNDIAEAFTKAGVTNIRQVIEYLVGVILQAFQHQMKPKAS